MTVARQSAWSQRWPRTGQHELPPRSWPVGGNLQSAQDDPYLELDPPAMQYPVVRGPLPNGYNVREELLDFSRGAEQGEAEIKRTPAMIPKLGELRFDLEHPILDDKFQYPQMGIPANLFRRIPRIYELPKAPAAMSTAFANAVSAVVNAPFQAGLATLDKDEELRAHFGHYFDFHPRLRGFCSTDVQSVRDGQVEDLIDRIENVPARMAAVFQRMYQEQLAALQAQIDALQSVGTPEAAAQIASLEARKAPLEEKIEQLSQFQASLR
jgi:hypothetical protein